MSIVVHVTSTEKVLRGAVRLSAAGVIPWQAEKLSSDRAGASASRPRKLFLDDGLESTFSPIYITCWLPMLVRVVPAAVQPPRAASFAGLSDAGR